MQQKPPRAMDRRSFFRALGGVSTAAVAAAAMSPREAKAYDPGDEETRARYQADAKDVKTFYRVNGYETLKK